MTPRHAAPPVARGPSAPSIRRFLDDVEHEVDQRLARLHAIVPGGRGLGRLVSGKKLRTRLVAHLAAAQVPGFDHASAVAASVATELVHSASLCHDDIIDEAELRRGRPTTWRRIGVPGAILVGDVLLVESFGVLAEQGHAEAVADFVETLAWVARAEMEQELGHRRQRGDAARWRRVCEGKTGALFAFPARRACPHAPRLAAALGRAGLCVGTAYQMYDDLLDQIGDEREAGKTLGQDAARGKHTIPAADGDERRVAAAAIDAVLGEATEVVSEWPRAKEAIESFIDVELRPCLCAVSRQAA